MEDARFFDKAARLDAAIDKGSPASPILEEVVYLVATDEPLRNYFFNHLKAPEWLQPLRERGFFTAPLNPVKDEVKGTIFFPRWPESRYLARMAELAPDMVLDIALSIPETDNLSIHEDLVDAALAMPPVVASKLAIREAEWLGHQSRLFSLLPDKLGKLITHLAKGNQIEVALHLAQVLLAVLPDPKYKEEVDEETAWKMSPEPVSRLDHWDYEQILKKNIPTLVDAAGQHAVTLLCSLLETAVTLSQRRRDVDGSEDYSDIWRRSIEGYQQHGIKDMLVSAVRDAVERTAGHDPSIVPTLVNILESYRWLIFKRLALHLLRFSPTSASDLITQRLTDKSNFVQRELRHEYIMLAKEHFPTLSGDQQTQILSWIDEGPDPETVRSHQEEWFGERPTDEEIDRYIKRTKLRRLEPFRDFLPDDWKRRYDAWTDELGKPEEAEYATPALQVSTGFASPITSEELHTKSVEQIVTFLASWRPPTGDFSGQSPEGLGHILPPIISSDPERFAKEAERFKSLNSTYVRYFISGIRDALKQKKSISSWPPILSLCQWIVEQSYEIQRGREDSPKQDSGWNSSRAAITDLLSTAFESEEAEIPFELRAEAWNVLKPLTNDPEPTPEYEAQYGGSNMDPLTLSMNTVRGEAIHAVMRYALWARRHIEEIDRQKLAAGFENMPEVRETLDYHLDPNHDPSLAIRAVYGLWVPWLIAIDRAWVGQNLRNIFPDDASLSNWRNAAWETYITFTMPYDNNFDVLHEEYRRAIERIGEETLTQSSRAEKPDDRLVEHLMVFYGRGKLDINDPEGLLSQFYRVAPDRLRAHALWFIGQSLREMDEVPSEVISRSRELCQRRIDIARTEQSETPYIEEMTAFGSIFASTKFDDAWAITQLKNALEISGWAEPDHLVVEHLAVLAVKHPRVAVDCLRILIQGDKEGWGILHWDRYARNILASALMSTDTEAKQLAVALVHHLGERGHWDYGDLLSI